MENLIKKKFLKIYQGFTLIELLIVIGIVAILAAFVFVMLNPLARFQDARNARRWSDINAIMSAIKLNQIDNKGIYLQAIANLTPDLYYQIGTGSECSSECLNPTVTLQSACVNLEGLADNAYLPTVPVDPNADGANADRTHYYLVRDSYNRIFVGACNEETGSNPGPPTIEIVR